VTLAAGQAVHLLDEHGSVLGSVHIVELRGDLILGEFTAGQGFHAVEHLFAAFEEAANAQVFSTLDKLGDAIDALRLAIGPDNAHRTEVHDVQIFNRRDISLRVKLGSEGNCSA
jgi:hypothetical protein